MNETPVTLPLFDEPVRVAKPKNLSIRSVAWGNCPGCRKGRIGIVRGVFHLMWREHTYPTWSGAHILCPASGVPVCQLTERTPTLLVRGRVRCDCETQPHLHAYRTQGGAAA